MTVPNVITPGIADGYNDTFLIQFGSKDDAGEIHTPTDYGLNVELLIFNRWGEKVYRSNDYKYDWNGADLGAGVFYYEVKVEGHVPCKNWVHLMK